MVLLPTGVGLTVTFDKNVLPGQPNGEVGVMVYRTEPVAELLPLVKVCAIVFPQPVAHAVLPLTKPVNEEVVHVNVLPGIFEFNPILVIPPLQIVALDVLPTGAGLIVTVTPDEGPDTIAVHGPVVPSARK